MISSIVQAVPIIYAILGILLVVLVSMAVIWFAVNWKHLSSVEIPFFFKGQLNKAKAEFDKHIEQKINQFDVIIGEHELSINQLLEQMAEDRTAIEKLVPKLTLVLYEPQKTNGGVVTEITLEPTSNVPLGFIVFQAKVIDNPNARILHFEPAGSVFGVCTFEISPDNGQEAHLQYSSVVSFGVQKLTLEVSEPCKVSLLSSRLVNESVELSLYPQNNS